MGNPDWKLYCFENSSHQDRQILRYKPKHDLEPSVINEVLNGSYGQLLHSEQLISDKKVAAKLCHRILCCLQRNYRFSF